MRDGYGLWIGIRLKQFVWALVIGLVIGVVATGNYMNEAGPAQPARYALIAPGTESRLPVVIRHPDSAANEMFYCGFQTGRGCFSEANGVTVQVGDFPLS